MREDPVAPPQDSLERMRVLDPGRADRALADVGHRQQGRDRVVAHVARQRAVTGGRGLEQQAREPAVVKGQTPTIGVRRGPTAAHRQRGERERDVRGGIAFHSEQLAHGPPPIVTVPAPAATLVPGLTPSGAPLRLMGVRSAWDTLLRKVAALAPIAVLLVYLPGEAYLRCRIDGSVRTACCCAARQAPGSSGPIARAQDCCDRETTVAARPVVEAPRAGAVDHVPCVPVLGPAALAMLSPPPLRRPLAPAGPRSSPRGTARHSPEASVPDLIAPAWRYSPGC